MSAPTKTIETPFGKNKIVIKEWITGQDREYIKNSMLEGIEAKPRIHGQDMSVDILKMDMKKFTNEAKYRAIEKYVVSVDGVSEGVVALVFGMNEHDTDFVLETIDELGKKKESTSTI